MNIALAAITLTTSCAGGRGDGSSAASVFALASQLANVIHLHAFSVPS